MNLQRSTRLISLCMIARNSEKTLSRALTSVQNVVDEIIVCDTGSTDATVEIARSFGARVFHPEWHEDFSAVRNTGIQEATCPWILVLDTDEWFEPREATKLRAAIEAVSLESPEPKLAFRLINRSLPQDSRGTGTAAYLTRLFPRHPEVRFEFPIHEQVETSLQASGFKIENLPVQMLHDGYADPALRLEKQARNLKILETQTQKGDVHPVTHFLKAGCLLDLARYREALDTYLLTYREAAKLSCPDLGNAALIRIISCLAKMKRWAELLQIARDVPETVQSHPEFLLALARAMEVSGNCETATLLMEHILTLGEAPRIPPVDLGQAKLEASEWLTTQVFRSKLEAPESP